MTATSEIFNTPTDLSTGNPDLIAREIHQMRPGVTLYSGYDDWKRIQVFGGFMWFPPDRKGHPTVQHPVEKNKDGSRRAYVANGRLTIKDRTGWVYTQVPGIGGQRGKPSYGNLVGQDIIAQVKFIVNKHPGIVWLRGDSSDAQQIARARAKSLEGRLTWARGVMERRRKSVQDFQKNQPGINPPPPSNREAEAQRVLDSGMGPNQYKEFVCQFFDAHYDTFTELQDHMLRTHNVKLEAPVGAEPKPEPTVAEIEAAVGG